MGKSIRSKSQKRLRTIKRQKLENAEREKVERLHKSINETRKKEEEAVMVVDTAEADVKMADTPISAIPSIPPAISKHARGMNKKRKQIKMLKGMNKKVKGFGNKSNKRKKK